MTEKLHEKERTKDHRYRFLLININEYCSMCECFIVILFVFPQLMSINNITYDIDVEQCWSFHRWNIREGGHRDSPQTGGLQEANTHKGILLRFRQTEKGLGN